MSDDLSSSTNSGKQVWRFGLPVLVLVLVPIVLFISMSKPLSTDEHMYCSAGILMSQRQLPYRDFAYPSQLPYHPLILSWIYRLTPTGSYLFWGRLLSTCADLVTLVSVLLVYKLVFSQYRRAGFAFGLLAVIWILFNPTVHYASGRAWNHNLVIACVAFSSLLFQHVKTKQAQPVLVCAITALLVAATWMRITTVLVFIFVSILLFYKAGPHARKILWPWLLSTLAASAWPLWLIAQAPRAFLLNLFTIPRLYGQWLHEIGRTHGKIELTWTCLTELVMLLFIAQCLVLLIWSRYRCKQSTTVIHSSTPDKVLVWGLPILFVFIAFVPPTMWDQYWAVPVPFLAIASAYPLKALWDYYDSSHHRVVCLRLQVLLGLLALFIILIHPVPLLGLVLTFKPQTWIPLRIHSIAQSIQSTVQPHQPVLTLAPLWALEGGYTIYPELSCGSIVYRVADQLTAEERQQLNVVGPDSLTQLIHATPPAAIFLDPSEDSLPILEDTLRRVALPTWQETDFHPGPVVITRGP